MNLNISGRLIGGFAAMGLILAIAVGATIYEVSVIDKTA
jgi:hypothetical protein